jgi:streptogramin lyase
MLRPVPLFAFAGILACAASAGTLVYQTNEGGNTVGIYTTSGVFVGSLTPALPFSTPYVAAVDSSLNVYISDYSNSRIVEFSPAGAQLASFTAGLGNPGGLAFDAAGDLFVVDRSDGAILKYSGGSETQVASIPGARGLTYYNGMLVTASSTSGNVVSFDVTGGSQTNLATALGSTDLRGVAYDSSGDLFITDVGNGSIYEISAGASTAHLFASGFSDPEYLAIDSTGLMYVPEYSGGDIRLVGPDGTNLGALVSGLDHPSSVALAVTPEPRSAVAMAMLLFGLIVFGILGKTLANATTEPRP